MQPAPNSFFGNENRVIVVRISICTNIAFITRSVVTRTMPCDHPRSLDAWRAFRLFLAEGTYTLLIDPAQLRLQMLSR